MVIPAGPAAPNATPGTPGQRPAGCRAPPPRGVRRGCRSRGTEFAPPCGFAREDHARMPTGMATRSGFALGRRPAARGPQRLTSGPPGCP
ncbi:hypothetical protein VT52_009675 [Streptomyces malaysiense]|uniref:Uncharacterized protein n=1 Tax=Streptomyces malaysiense TaxID=1428626 RepID=A0A1J4Q3W9_9ACTN|nr:hypothetical protein VT52_009675 [Streptomyces malaysiense]